MRPTAQIKHRKLTNLQVTPHPRYISRRWFSYGENFESVNHRMFISVLAESVSRLW